MNIFQSIAELESRMDSFDENLTVVKASKLAKVEAKEKYEAQIRKLESVTLENRQKIADYQKAIELFKKIADFRNEEAKEKLQTIMNWALSQIPLDENFEAIIEESDSSRSGKELNIKLRDLDSGNVLNLKYQSGNALCQIISFLINVILFVFLIVHV